MICPQKWSWKHPQKTNHNTPPCTMTAVKATCHRWKRNRQVSMKIWWKICQLKEVDLKIPKRQDYSQVVSSVTLNKTPALNCTSTIFVFPEMSRDINLCYQCKRRHAGRLTSKCSIHVHTVIQLKYPLYISRWCKIDVITYSSGGASRQVSESSNYMVGLRCLMPASDLPHTTWRVFFELWNGMI